MPEEQPPEPELSREEQLQVINGVIALMFQRLAAAMAPDTATDDQIECFLTTVQASLGSHFVAMVLCCMKDGAGLRCTPDRALDHMECLRCTSHEVLDLVLDTFGDEIIQETSGPRGAVH